MPTLTAVEAGAAFTFDGEPASFKLAGEARRIRLAQLFDPQASLGTSDVDPLPHQSRVVYEDRCQREVTRVRRRTRQRKVRANAITDSQVIRRTSSGPNRTELVAKVASEGTTWSTQIKALAAFGEHGSAPAPFKDAQQRSTYCSLNIRLQGSAAFQSTMNLDGAKIVSETGAVTLTKDGSLELRLIGAPTATAMSNPPTSQPTSSVPLTSVATTPIAVTKRPQALRRHQPRTNP